jgi:hypothetical protein
MSDFLQSEKSNICVKARRKISFFLLELTFLIGPFNFFLIGQILIARLKIESTLPAILTPFITSLPLPILLFSNNPVCQENLSLSDL